MKYLLFDIVRTVRLMMN